MSRSSSPPRPFGLSRCRTCGLEPRLCPCALLPRLSFELDVRILQHVSERPRGSNSGRLLQRLVDGTSMEIWGAKEGGFDEEVLHPDGVDLHVLFPREGAPELSARLLDDCAARGRRPGLLLLDATWRQARVMARRVPGLWALPFVRLPPGAPPRWDLRRAPSADRVSTVEAALRALAVLYGDDRVEPLVGAMEIVRLRNLHVRGRFDRRGLAERESQYLEALASHETPPGSTSTPDSVDSKRLLRLTAIRDFADSSLGEGGEPRAFDSAGPRDGAKGDRD